MTTAALEKEEKKCQWPECKHLGEYPAPSSQADLKQYRYYCLNHIREYNANWDYFIGKNQDEILAYQKECQTGHRPTTTMGINSHDPIELEKQFHRFLDEDKPLNRYRIFLPQKEQDALDTLELQYPVTAEDIKLRYRELVKTHHPDKNNNCKKATKKFQKIQEAYTFLKTCERY